jgi:hypothetical protein
MAMLPDLIITQGLQATKFHNNLYIYHESIKKIKQKSVQQMNLTSVGRKERKKGGKKEGRKQGRKERWREGRKEEIPSFLHPSIHSFILASEEIPMHVKTATAREGNGDRKGKK